MALQDGDHLLVQRNGASYKETAANVKAYVKEPAATEAVAGVAEIATQAEANAGVDDERIITPLKMVSYVTEQLKATWLPPNNIPPEGIGSSTWNGPADTLTATPDVEVSIDGGPFGTGGPIAPSNTVQVRWITAAVVAANHAQQLTGRVSNAVGDVSVDYTATVDKLPDAITIAGQSGTALGAVVESVGSNTIGGLNASCRLWFNSSDGTNPEISINNATWAAIPALPASGLPIRNGDSFRLRHTTKLDADAVTTTSVRVGWDATDSEVASFATTNTSIPPLTEATPTTISGVETVGNTLTAVEGTATGGFPPINYATRWQRSVTGTDGWSDIAGATNVTYTLVTADGNQYVRAVTTASDSTPAGAQTLELASASSGQIVATVAPVVGTLTLSDSTAGGNRFTSEVFPTELAMLEDGVPPSTKGLKAKVEGLLQYQPLSGPITNVIAGTGPSQLIPRSVRFDGSASLTRGAYAGSGTFSCWVKRSTLNVTQTIINGVAFDANNNLNGSVDVFRDPEAWMHIVVSAAGTYVNGISVGTGSAVTPGAIGVSCNLYLADIHFIDGQALDPTSFGEFNGNGVWQPKAYSGSYGTNGFYLPFSDNSTDAALGTDTSGNGNDWTVNNISVAAGAGNDSLVDTPTSYGVDAGNGGEVRGNYATLNPLNNAGAAGTYSNGNLEITTGSSQYGAYVSTIATPTSGKWYAEAYITSGATTRFGFVKASYTPNSTEQLGNVAGTMAYRCDVGDFRVALTTKFTGGATCTSGDTVGLALDNDNGEVKIYKNGTLQGTATGIEAANWCFAGSDEDGAGTASHIWNFGARPFAYTAPSGFKALCTTNLPDPNLPAQITGSFEGNNNVDGPFVYTGCLPGRIQYGTIDVTYGNRIGQSDVDFCANGFKVRSTASNSGTVNYIVTTDHTDGEYFDQVGTVKVPFANASEPNTLEFASATDIDGFEAGDSATEIGGGDDASGTVRSVNPGAVPPNMQVSGTNWTVGAQVQGPLKTATTPITMYAVLDASGNVSDLQSADPGFVAQAGVSPYNVTFPATLPSGNPPDVELPVGSTLTTEIEASNTSGSDTGVSNTITPA